MLSSRPTRLFVTVAATALMLTMTACSNHKTTQATAAQLVQAGLLAVQQGNDAAAFSAFADAAKKDPRNFYAHYNLGTLLQRQGKTPEALQEYGLALQINPTYVPALFNEATIYGATDPTLAIVTYKRVVGLQPKAPTAYLNLGLLEARLGLWAESKKDLQTALDQDPSLVGSIPKNVFAKEPKSPSPTPHR